MPYEIRGNAVVKKDTGKVVGYSKHPKEYLKALYAAEGRSKKKKHHSANDGKFIDDRRHL